MNQLLIISLIAGVMLGIVSAGTGAVVLHRQGSMFVGGLDLDLYYREMDALKREVNDDSGAHNPTSASPAAILFVGLGSTTGIVMAILTRVILAWSLNFGTSVLIILIVWLLVTVLPLYRIMSLQAKQIVILELASVLERIARNQDEIGEIWAICAAKTITGGDLFGEDLQDHLELRISRNEVAPIVLRIRGRVEVAEAGLERSVNKIGVRQLRIEGWLMNEICDTEVEIEYQWSLHDNTYVDISNRLAWTVQALGFPLRKMRLSRLQPDQEEKHVN